MAQPSPKESRSVRNALRFVDEFGGGPASDFDVEREPGVDSSIAALRAIADELRAGLADLKRILRR